MYSNNQEFEIKETHSFQWGGHFLTRIEIRNIQSLPAALKRLSEMGHDLSEAREALQATTNGQPNNMSEEDLAKFFHENYERLAPQFSYETRKASAVPWKQVPENNKNLMIAVAAEVLKHFGLKP